MSVTFDLSYLCPVLPEVSHRPDSDRFIDSEMLSEWAVQYSYGACSLLSGVAQFDAACFHCRRTCFVNGLSWSVWTSSALSFVAVRFACLYVGY